MKSLSYIKLTTVECVTQTENLIIYKNTTKNGVEKQSKCREMLGSRYGKCKPTFCLNYCTVDRILQHMNTCIVSRYDICLMVLHCMHIQ